MRSSHYKAGRFTPQASKLASYYGSFCEGLVAEISGTNRRLSADALRISQLDRRADARSPALGRWLMFRISELTLSPTGETALTARLLVGNSGTPPDGSRRAEQHVGKPAVKVIRVPSDRSRPKLRGERDSSCHRTVSSFPTSKRPRSRVHSPIEVS